MLFFFFLQIVILSHFSCLSIIHLLLLKIDNKLYILYILYLKIYYTTHIFIIRTFL